MAAQKRKSVLVEPPAKRRKLDKTSKLVTTSKERKLPDIKHASNKSARLRKDMHKTTTKSRRPSVSKSINRSPVPSSQSKQAQKHTKQTLNELKKKTLKTICMKRSSLKSLGKLSPIKASPKSSKISQANHRNSTKCSSKIRYRGKGKPSVVKSKTSHEHKKQKKPSVDNNKCSSGVLRNRRSSLPIKPTQKKRCSVTKSVKENFKKDQMTEKGNRLRSSSTSNKIQKSNNSCPQNLAFQPPKPTAIETDEKACDPDRRKMTTRSEGAKANKSPATAGQEQMPLKRTRAMSQKEMTLGLPGSQCTATDHEPQTRRSLRLQQTSSVPTESVCNRSRKKEATSVRNSPPMKRPAPHIKKPKPAQPKMEDKPLKSEGRNKGKEILTIEKTGPLKGNTHTVALAPSKSMALHNKDQESRNSDCCLQESKNEPVGTVSCSLTSSPSVISKEKESVHRSGKSRAKAKRVLPAPVSLPADHAEDVMKSKKFSILELCEEIAGEIESDTVEVKRESPGTEDGKEEEKDNVAALELPQTVVSAEEGTNQNSLCKRFFPSKKGVPMKCTVNGRHSTGNKNSKWPQIKFKKVNHVSQSISNSSSTPQPGFLKCSVPERQQVGAAELQLAEAQKKSAQSRNSSSPMCGQKLDPVSSEGILVKEVTSHAEQPIQAAENGLFEGKHGSEPTPDENFNLHLESSPENTPMKIVATQSSTKQIKKDVAEVKSEDPAPKQLVRTLFPDKTSGTNDSSLCPPKISLTSKCGDVPPSEEHIQKLKEAGKESDKQLVIDAGQKRFGAISCNVCGMLYTAANPEDETQHLLFHNQFISAVKYVGWKKERILAEYPDGKIIMVLPDDPKYALRKVDEIREMVDNDLGFQQAPLTCSRTKTLLFISNDKKVIGCLIAEHIQWGYRVIEEKVPEISTENEKVTFERQKAWCCSTSPEPALCGISRIWVFNLMRRKKIASRMLECLRNNFIYGSYLSKEEMAFSDPTPDGKLFATQYFGTSQFLVYNFVSGQQLT